MEIELKITKKEMTVTFLLIVFSVVVFLAVQVVLYFQLQYEKALIEKKDLTNIIGAVEPDLFKDLALSAEAYYVWDVQNKEVIAEANGEVQLPLASLTKLMTSLVAVESSPEKSLIKIDEQTLAVEGDSGLILGEIWKLKDMLDFVLVTSSNDGAQALASIYNGFIKETSNSEESKTFLSQMNEKAQSLGMRQSYFLNESGLDVNINISGAYGSAKDMTILMERILQEYPTLLEASSHRRLVLNSDIAIHEAFNTNVVIDRLPGVIASKTGYTDLAGGNLVMAFDLGLGHQIIISVLGSTKEERFSDIEKLIWTILKKEFKEDIKIL